MRWGKKESEREGPRRLEMPCSPFWRNGGLASERKREKLAKLEVPQPEPIYYSSKECWVKDVRDKYDFF